MTYVKDSTTYRGTYNSTLPQAWYRKHSSKSGMNMAELRSLPMRASDRALALANPSLFVGLDSGAYRNQHQEVSPIRVPLEHLQKKLRDH
jgi:hypothetical protein